MDTGALVGYLHRLAYLYNVQTAYYDVTHHRQTASVEGLMATLRVLGAPVSSLADVPSALRERRQALRQRILEPVTVAWNGECPVIKVCLPVEAAEASPLGYLELEDNQRQSWRWQATELPVLESVDVEGTGYVVKQITLPGNLPWGYHRFFLEIKGSSAETLVISAPRRTYSPPEDARSRLWGTFLPLYALPTQGSWGSGDYSGLEALADWLAGMGGQVVATLPLLPVFLDEPFEPSPYAPVSRRLWNEFYLDINRVPGLAECPPAQAMLSSSSFQTEIKELRDSSSVDYRRLMALKRAVLEELCRCLVAGASDRLGDFRSFARGHPIVEDYARFRAAMEAQRSPWPSWPQRLRDGSLNEGDYDEKNKLYHMYAQWLAYQQVQAVSEEAREKGVMLYFDLPLGVHQDGYDAWRERHLFALNVSAGAPPDAVFTRGQDWRFMPLHPERVREHGYRYVIDYLRHHLRYADILRLDHVMGLHRLFWIPKGLDARHGVYVRYPTEELYAILALESHRHRSLMVGEDLGIVPSYVRPAMTRHGLHRMYVLHYELAASSSETLGTMPQNSVASLNTHDMSPFAAFWQGLDIPERLGIGLLDKKGARVESRARQSIKHDLIAFLRNKGLLRGNHTDIRAVLKSCLSFLSASRARIVLVNLEDLWQETRPQNIPGTDEYPNWQQKARYALEEFCQMLEVRDTLKEIDRIRKQGV